MKIILSPAKEMNLENPIEKEWSISKNTKLIIDSLKKLSHEDLKKKLKINDKILQDNLEYYKGFDKPTSYEALDMYNGLAFRWLDFNTLKEDEKSYLDENLLILSALYGPIKALDLVKPYRLDFNTSVRVNKKTLKNLWKVPFNEAIQGHDYIINLASDEFSGFLDRDSNTIIDFEFYELKEDKLRKHSTISKKARGLVARFMAQNEIKNIEEIKTFNLDGYEFSAKDSDDLKFVFIKNIK